MIRLELTTSGTSKFWESEVTGKSVTTRWGEVGNDGTAKTHRWPSPAAAQAAHDRLVTSKFIQGYVYPKAAMDARALAKTLARAGAIVHPRNAALEAEIRADRTDLGAYAVYGDWLQAHGSALGELIILEQAHAKRKDPAKQKRAAAIKRTLALPTRKLATIAWRAGMWRSIRLENELDWTDEKFDAVAVARPLFASPLCAALEELRLGILRWDSNDRDIPAVLAEASTQAWAADLVGLHLGDKSNEVDMAHLDIGAIGAVVSKGFRRLRWLKLTSGDRSWSGGKHSFGIGPLALPELASLVVETCSMSRKRLAHVLEATLPRLETLELWFGSRSYGAITTIKELEPLLDSRVHAKVKHLGLRNAEFTDALVRALPGKKLASRLESLDLSMGTMSDEGAAALAAGAKAFAKLTRLSIDDNFLSPASVRAVTRAFPGVTVVSRQQKDVDESSDGEIHRYVSVAE